MQKIAIHKGIKFFFTLWLSFVEIMICIGIVILSLSNYYSIAVTIAFIGSFLFIFNTFLYFFIGGFVKEIILDDQHIIISFVRNKPSVKYAFSTYTFESKDRSSNYYLLIKKKESNETFRYHIGLLTQKQRTKINQLRDKMNPPL